MNLKWPSFNAILGGLTPEDSPGFRFMLRVRVRVMVRVRTRDLEKVESSAKRWGESHTTPVVATNTNQAAKSGCRF